VRWTNYPTQADQNNSSNGADVSGQVWSAGPAPGTKWCLPEGLRHPVVVIIRATSNGGKPYSVGPLSQVKPLPDQAAGE
jgi:hypothetical protein